jgi:hypothetical protein
MWRPLLSAEALAEVGRDLAPLRSLAARGGRRPDESVADRR